MGSTDAANLRSQHHITNEQYKRQHIYSCVSIPRRARSQYVVTHGNLHVHEVPSCLQSVSHAALHGAPLAKHTSVVAVHLVYGVHVVRHPLQYTTRGTVQTSTQLTNIQNLSSFCSVM